MAGAAFVFLLVTSSAHERQPASATSQAPTVNVPPGATRVVNADRARGGALAICAETADPPIERGVKRVPSTFVWIDEGRVNERGERTVRRNVATGPGACDPAWSPEGQRLAVTSPDGLWVFVDVTSAAPRGERIVDTTGRAESVAPATEYKGLMLSKPKWSPDGVRIAYLASNGGTTWGGGSDAANGKRVFKSEPERYSFTWGVDSRSLRVGDRTTPIP